MTEAPAPAPAAQPSGSNNNAPAANNNNQHQPQPNNNQQDQPQGGPTDNPWVPDASDALNIGDLLGDLSPGATPEQVMSALEQQILRLDATLTDLATGDNQRHFSMVTRRRAELNERLSTLRPM